MKKKIKILTVALILMLSLSGCATIRHWLSETEQTFRGTSAVMSTYSMDGKIVDEVKGKSFQISRASQFDSVDSEGVVQPDSQVLRISLGNNHIYHVGSTMVLAEQGLEDLMKNKDIQISLDNNQPGKPWLNNLIRNYADKWQGKGKTVIIRSQDGLPIATFVGNSVEIFSTEIPKSTWFQVDGKMLFVYRADYTVYDNNLLE